MFLIKIIFVLTLVYILFQDVKERKVYWFLFPIVGLCSGILHYFETLPELFYSSVTINLVFVSILLMIVLLYSKLKLKAAFSSTFGLGDVLIFLALAFSFSSISFIILFIGALIFSLALHIVLKRGTATVPLAGYMCLFFALSYIGHWFGLIGSVYSI